MKQLSKEETKTRDEAIIYFIKRTSRFGTEFMNNLDQLHLSLFFYLISEYAQQEVKSNASGICNIIVGECGVPEWLNQPITIGEIKDIISFHSKNIAIAFMDWLNADYSTSDGIWAIEENDNGIPNGKYTTEQLYELYQQSKPPKP